MAWQQNEGSSSSCCFSRSRRHRVRPISPNTGESQLLEIRPKRFLHIQHINARPRDTRFEKEMNMQLMYRHQGLQSSMVSAGPLTMPKSNLTRTAAAKPNTQSSTPLPNSVDATGGGDSSKREISASGKKAEFASPSSVQVAMHNMPVSESGVPVPSTAPNSAGAEPAAGTEQAAEFFAEKVINSLSPRRDTGGESHTTEAVSKASPNKTPSHNSLGPTESHTGEGDSGLSDSELAEISAAGVSHTSPSIQSSNNIASHTVDQTPKSTPKHNGVMSPGRPPTTVLFFLHGVGGSSNVWQAQIRHFAKDGYEIVAPDLIGHGLSCTPKDRKSYHFMEIAADMEEIFDKYCKKRNVVIGHSYGCSFAVLLARKRSRRVQKLVLISGGAPTPLAPQPGLFSLPTCMLGCFRPCLNCGFHKSAFHATRKPVVDKEEAFSIPTYVLQHTMNGQDWPDGDELYHQWLLCPTLLIYGAQDRLVTLKEEEHMEEVIYRSRLEVIPDASHMVMIEAPEEVNRLLHSFLTEDSTLCTKSNSPIPPAQPPAPVPQHQDPRPYSRMSVKSTKSHKAMPSHLT